MFLSQRNTRQTILTPQKADLEQEQCKYCRQVLPSLGNNAHFLSARSNGIVSDQLTMKSLEDSACRGRVLTFGRGVRAVGGDLPHARAVAAQRHQPGDDGGLAEADVAHDDDAAVDAGVGALQLRVDLVEHPVPAHEHRLGGDAGDLEQQRLQGDVGGSVGCEADWKETWGKDVNANRHFGNGCLQRKR